ncbi:MAG: hypothetical protein V4478_01055 [Patescibacteria group bacterium]
MSDNLNADGSYKDRTFTTVEGIEYPAPNIGTETYGQYYQRVRELKEKGFHLGDLSQDDYVRYCDGQGHNGIRPSDIME